MRDKGASSGNIFFVLFAAIGLVGALAGSVQTFIAGPLRTSTFVNQKGAVDAQLDISKRVAMTNAYIKQPAGGDCDGDGTVEPIPYDAGGGASVPVGGGLLPVSIAGNVRDPWGNRYGYCTWDHGSTVDDAGCGGAGQNRLMGTNATNWPAVAIISAGPNRVFETTCNDWVDANVDSQPDTPLVQRAAITDDMHKTWSLDEAGGSASCAACTADTWTAQTAVGANQWMEVVYANGLFVAVSENGAVMTSPDGITWTARTAAAGNFWYGLTYGNGLFVAVSGNGTNRVMTSPDGITWTARTAATADTWTEVAYGNGVFVAVSYDGTVMTSPDGITWTARTAAEANPWEGLTYGNGLFVAVSVAGTNRVMTSPDGITWTARTAVGANSMTSVTYGNGLFVAVAMNGTNRVMTSPDGITWTARTEAEANIWRSVTYGNGLFVAVSTNGANRVMTSTDGITWTARTAAEANSWMGLTYGNGKFVAVSEDGTNRVMTSTCPVCGGGGGGGDLWSVEGGDPNTVEIDKNISVKDGSNNEQLAFDATSRVLTIGAGGEGAFPTLRTNRIEELTGPADPNDLQTQTLDPLTFAPEDGSGISYSISNPTGDNLIVSDGTRSVLQFRADAAGPVSTDGFKIFDPPTAGTGGAEFTTDSMGLNLISSLNASPAMNVEMANVNNTAGALTKPNRVIATPSNEAHQALYMNLETNGAAATNLAGNITFHTRPSGLGTSGPGPERMRIEAGGDVGIGITNPTTRLHVVGNTILGDGGNVAIGTTTMSERLNINGALRLGSGGEACILARAGAFRYNTTSDCVEVCNGSAWSCIIRDSCADITPEILAWGGTSYFEDQINATASTVTATRNTFQVNSVSNNCTLEVFVSGPGSPESRVCSDSACSTVVQAWSSSPRPVTAGQFVQLRATSPATAGAQHKIMARIGTAVLPWVLGTRNNDCTIPGPELGTLCADGTIYIGRSPDGWAKMYATPCRQGQTLSGGVCTGVASSLRWSNNNTIATGRVSRITGEANTTALAALANADAPYSAAQACDSLSFGGQTDWYLPSMDEAVNFVGVCSKQNMPGCTTFQRFWTSTELSASRARVWQSGNDFLWDDPKNFSYNVWCVRKD